MLDGEHYTKQQVSVATGLSVATVGRSSVLYKVNDNHESYLIIHFYVYKGDKIVETIIFTPTGVIVSRDKKNINVSIMSNLKKSYII